jgi:hypothetical protein
MGDGCGFGSTLFGVSGFGGRGAAVGRVSGLSGAGIGISGPSPVRVDPVSRLGVIIRA